MSEGDKVFEDNTQYRSLVGGLLYVASWCRPDIMYSVISLAQHQQSPTQLHWAYAKQVLCYLKTTASLGLVYSALRADSVAKRLCPSLRSDALYGFADASYAEDAGRKSHSGHVFFYGSGPPSSRQTVVARSSCEAEIVALDAASTEALWLRDILDAVLGGGKGSQPVVMFEDNQSAMMFSSKVENDSNRTKHIGVRYFHLKELVHAGTLTLVFTPTADQVADCLTKSLDLQAFNRCRSTLLCE